MPRTDVGRTGAAPKSIAMNHVVITRQLTKRYGTTAVVQNLDLQIPAGCVSGFLGPNGSGKTTTMKILLSLITPSAGEVEIFGQPMRRETRHQLLGRIGSLIENPSAYGHLTGRENLRIVQRTLDASDQAVSRAVRLVRMEQQLDKLVRNYSLGMKQRLGIAMALVRDPQLLILDEPTNGLDPAGIEEIRDLLVWLAREEGRTVMVSSHLLSEVERMASVIGILNRGQLLFQGSLEQLFDRRLPDVLVRTPDAPRAIQVLQRLNPTTVADGLLLQGLDQPTVAATIAHLCAAQVPIWEVRRQQRSLEDVFIGLTGREGLL